MTTLLFLYVDVYVGDADKTREIVWTLSSGSDMME